MKKILVTLIFFFCLFAQKGFAQDSINITTPVNFSYRSTLLGIGSYSIRDTYLSPEEYTGWGINLLSDLMKMTNKLKGKLSTQQLIMVDFASTKNNTETASDYYIMLDYGYGGHYHFKPISNLRLLAGMKANVNLGAIYNTRNTNNPVSAKAGVNLNFSGMADYKFHIGKQPLSIRYQMDMPFFGCMFSPHYGQSYYEISLGNHDDLVHVSSFGNLFAMKNYLTIEIPLKYFTIRTTYLNNIYQTDICELKTQIHSNSFMIGFVKEVFSMPKGKKLNKENYRRVFD